MGVATPTEIIQQYYDLYNRRRFEEAGALFAPDAVIEHAPYGTQTRRGGTGYIDSAELSVQAFPDATIAVLAIEPRGDTVFEVDLVASGTHLGRLDMGTFGRFEPTGATIRLRHREVLDIRDGTIVYASVTFDVQELVAQLKPT
jgi:predicted ester cyclase